MIRMASIEFPGWAPAETQRPQPGLVLISDGYRVDLGRAADRLTSEGLAIQISHWMPIPQLPFIKTSDGFPEEWEYVLVRSGDRMIVASWCWDEAAEMGTRRRWYQGNRALRVRRWLPLPPGPLRVGLQPFDHRIAYAGDGESDQPQGDSKRGPLLDLVTS